MLYLYRFFTADAALQLKEAELAETIINLLGNPDVIPEILCNTLTLTKTVCQAGRQPSYPSFKRDWTNFSDHIGWNLCELWPNFASVICKQHFQKNSPQKLDSSSKY